MFLLCVVEESMVDVNDILTETKAEDIKYALSNTKYKLYIRYGKTWSDNS